jgi:hypothetical protein
MPDEQATPVTPTAENTAPLTPEAVEAIVSSGPGITGPIPESGVNTGSGSQLVEKQPTPPVVPGAPSLGRGHEEPSDMDEIEIPRAKLVQFVSDEAQSENKEDRKDPGSIINSITKEVLGSIFIPVFKFTNFIQWNPRKKDDPNYDAAYEPGAIVFQTIDRNDPRVVEGGKFGPNGEAPKVTRYMNFLTYFPGHMYPLILSFSKSSFAAGKRLNSLTQFTGGDMFSQKYRIITQIRDNAGTKFFVLDVAPGGPVSQEEYAIAEHWYQEFRGKNLKIHSEEAAAEGGPGWSE